MTFLSASILQLILGAFLSLLISLAAWGLHWLNRSGAIAAFILGLIVFGLGGFSWAVLLLVFFVSSSLLSILFRRKKKESSTFFEKSSKRDAGQVLANGGVAGFFVVLHVFFPDSWLPWTGFTAALAAANADTWATELGVLSKKLPVLITSGKKVERGTSGAISLTGTLASIIASALIALAAWIFWPAELIPGGIGWILLIILAGFLGGLVDSTLGATLQAIYYCPACNTLTEKPLIHFCGEKTEFKRGWRWLDNDCVNLACTTFASLFSILTVLLLIF